MGYTLQSIARYVGALIVGLILGALLHQQYAARQTVKQEAAQATQHARKVVGAVVFREAAKARGEANRALAAAALSAAIASEPEWATTSVPPSIIESLRHESYDPHALPDDGGVQERPEVEPTTGMVEGVSAPSPTGLPEQGFAQAGAGISESP